MFKFEIFLCLLAALVSLGAGNETDPVSHFVIKKDETSICVGTVIKNYKVTEKELQWTPKVQSLTTHIVIVTAAHCVRGVPVSKLKICRDDSCDPEYLSVVRVIVHPFYKPTNVDFDVALLKLNGTDLAPPVKSLSLAKSSPGPKEKLQVVDPSVDRQNVTLIDLKSCQTQLGTRLRLSSQMLCASVSAPVRDGSALINNPKQDIIFGVAFFGGKNNLPRVFMNIAHPEISAFIKKYTEM